MTSNARRNSSTPTLAGIVRAGGLAALIAVVANVAIYLIANAAGAIDATVVNPMGDPIGLAAVLSLTIGAAIVAAILFALLVRFAPRPGTIFLAVAALVFALFLMGPFNLGAPVAMVLVLELMHLVVALPLVLLLLRTLR
jgi:purine-cytosine permease-like protein